MASFNKTRIQPFNSWALDLDFGPNNLFRLQEGKCSTHTSNSSLEESNSDEEDLIEDQIKEDHIANDRIEKKIEELTEEKLLKALTVECWPKGACKQ